MWKLTTRGARGTPFSEIGSFESISAAAAAVSKIENNPGWIFFKVSVNTLSEESSSDAEVLSLLSYQGSGRYYELERSAN